MTSKSDPILIVGGGIGGLATALALGLQGRRVHVFEQAQEFGAIGYGIQLGPNVFHMFDRLGISDAVKRASDVPSGVRLVNAYTGEEFSRVPTGPSFLARFKHPYIIVHRVDLHHTLLDACKAVPTIEFGPATTVTGYEDRGDKVVATTDGGGSFEGAALIGADGLRSRIRAQLIGETEPRQIGYVAHRTIVPMTDLPPELRRDDVVFWCGSGFHIVQYPLRQGTLFNIVAVFRTATFSEKLDTAAYTAELNRTYRNAHPSMKAVLAMMDLERRWPIADRDPIRHWHKGRVALLGDAAHPTLQTLAQGACMAVEDGVCLAETIDLADGDFARAFAHYEAERRVRTARVVLESRHLWEISHADGIARDVFLQAFSERTEADVFQCLAWLYDGYKLPTELKPSANRSATG